MSYCDARHVNTFLRLYEADLEDSSLLGSAAQVTALINQLLPTSKGMVDVLARRDFDYHASEVVYIDGDGESDQLFLGAMGKAPIISIASIVENATTVPATDYTILGDYATAGIIRKWTSTGYESGGAWDSGVRNIKVTLTYGYAAKDDIPQEIKDAQAQLTASMILGQASGAGSGGVKSISIGAFSVTYGAGHAWAPVIEGWVESAMRACKFHRPVQLWGAG